MDKFLYKYACFIFFLLHLLKRKMASPNFFFFLFTYFLILQNAPFCAVARSLVLPKAIAEKLRTDLQTINLASTDYGRIIKQNPFAVFFPVTANDIAGLIRFMYASPTPYYMAARGQGHSVRGQALVPNGVVVNMTSLASFRQGAGRIVVSTAASYADVGGEQLWIDVLHATMHKGLTPVSWTDYLHITVGGTLSNAGISGQTFRFGPQISNVYELDVVTGLFLSLGILFLEYQHLSLGYTIFRLTSMFFLSIFTPLIFQNIFPSFELSFYTSKDHFL